MELTRDQKVHLIEHGYVVLPGVVPRAMVDAAVRAINHSLGTRGLPPDQLSTLAAQSYCPEVRGTAVIGDLAAATPLWSLAESAIGPGTLAPRTGGQIALRFPTLADRPKPPGPHIDGTHSPTNGVPEGTVFNFAALAGVMLSDQPTAGYGNFHVWPGSHRKFAAHFREHDPRTFVDGTPRIDIGAPVAVCGRAGDAVLAHYLLGHGVGPNTSPHVRYMTFHRLTRRDHDATRWESMSDEWLQWDGLRDLAAELDLSPA